jgi:hypothetical protein
MCTVLLAPGDNPIAVKNMSSSHQVIEGKIKGEMEATRRRRELLDDLKDRKGYSHLKAEALDRTMRRKRFGGGFKPVVIRIRMNALKSGNRVSVVCIATRPVARWSDVW